MISMTENLILGSGVAGIATAMALKDLGQSFDVLDVAFDLSEKEAAAVQSLKNLEPSSWPSRDVEKIFPLPEMSATGIKRRLAFGSDFPYRMPAQLKIEAKDCSVELSHSFGGLGNVWGGAMLPYSDQMLKSWPIRTEEMKRSYAEVLKYVPLSAERDALAAEFPLYTNALNLVPRSEQTERWLKNLNKRAAKLKADGIEFGRARVAVNSNCKLCGRCIEGCVYEAIFNPKQLWTKMPAVNFHKGFYALEFQEHPEHVVVRAKNIREGSVREFKAKNLFLATGHIATTRLIATSLKYFNEKIKILDSQYFYFPLFSYGKTGEDIRYTLVESFLEVMNKSISEQTIHFHVLGQNRLFEKAVKFKEFSQRMYMLQGFLHSDDSARLEMTVLPPQNGRDEIRIQGIDNPRAHKIAKKSQKLLRQHLLKFGIIPPSHKLVAPGRSFHGGGSFPMGGKDRIFSADEVGRPASLNRVHIMDSASFPNIPGSTIAYSIMANADRIVRALKTN
jgi:hypothetical protein